MRRSDGNDFWCHFNKQTSRGSWQFCFTNIIGQVFFLCHFAIDATIRETEKGDTPIFKKIFSAETEIWSGCESSGIALFKFLNKEEIQWRILTSSSNLYSSPLDY